jgi:hypothetical protein
MNGTCITRPPSGELIYADGKKCLRKGTREAHLFWCDGVGDTKEQRFDGIIYLVGISWDGTTLYSIREDCSRKIQRRYIEVSL